MNAPQPQVAAELKSHDLVDDINRPGVRCELRPARRPGGEPVAGLFNAWITLDDPGQFNSYTTDMVKGVILAFRAASNARDVNCVVFTGSGTAAFCTGGNAREYAEHYAGQPQEYRRYMRLFNDMVSAILACDKPVICRVNGMRIGGGQEIGMACDFSVAQDLARFGQAGPKCGSAPAGGAIDFLPVIGGAERARLALNMMTEARSDFTAFNEDSKDDREIDFVLLRQKQVAGQSWVGPQHDPIQPRARHHG